VKRGDDQAYACRLRIASQNVTQRRLLGVYRIVSQRSGVDDQVDFAALSVFGVFLPNAASVAQAPIRLTANNCLPTIILMPSAIRLEGE
jgi:hypothetical protein